MKKKTRHLIIIIINLFLVATAGIPLLLEFINEGHIEWVSQHAIEDHEEFYFTPICFSIAVLGLFALIFETIKLFNITFESPLSKTLQLILKFISFLYGSLITGLCLILIFAGVSNMKNHGNSFSIFSETFLSILIISCFCLLGLLIIYSSIKDE